MATGFLVVCLLAGFLVPRASAPAAPREDGKALPQDQNAVGVPARDGVGV